MRRAAEEQEQQPNEQGGGEAGEVGREQIGSDLVGQEKGFSFHSTPKR